MLPLEPVAAFDALRVGVDLTLFPFDVQFCELQFGSWADSQRRVNYTLMGPGNPYDTSVGIEGPVIQSVSFQVNLVGGEVLDRTFSCCPGSNYPQVFFYIAFTRYNVDYLRNIFVPVCLSVIVGFLAYWIPVVWTRGSIARINRIESN